MSMVRPGEATIGERPVYFVYHDPAGFARRSGYPALIELMRGRIVPYHSPWESLTRRSWFLADGLWRYSRRYYGSEWNALIPHLDERRMARLIPCQAGAVVHFVFAEFASPRNSGWFRKKGNRLVSTFHCSIRRLPAVLRNFRCWDAYDAWSVTSKTQIPYFLEHGVRESDIRVVPLGVDAAYFRPDPGRRGPEGGAMRAILVGKTERDHEFMVEVMKALPPGTVDLSVCTHPAYHIFYRGVPGVRVLPFVSDNDLLRLYQDAELMIMPFLDCTTNDALMECMACGTPVMTNRVGGISEYVDGSCNILMDGKRVGDWVDRLVAVQRDRASIRGMREPVRRWAERFDWPAVAGRYRALYEGRPADAG